MKEPRLFLVKSGRLPPVRSLTPQGVDPHAPVTGKLFDAVVRAVYDEHLPMYALLDLSDAFFMGKALPDYVTAALDGGPV
jgi:hypothetical protein